MAAVNVLQHVNCRYFFRVSVYIQIFWIICQYKGKCEIKILSLGPILRCCCLKLAWISNIFSCSLSRGKCRSVMQLSGWDFPPAVKNFRSWPVNSYLLMTCELKCIVSQLTLLMMQEDHVVLNVLKFNNSMPSHIHIRSLCEGAFSQFVIKTI